MIYAVEGAHEQITTAEVGREMTKRKYAIVQTARVFFRKYDYAVIVIALESRRDKRFNGVPRIIV